MRVGKPNQRPIPADLAVDYKIFSGRALWKANKNPDYRESVRALLASLHDFMRDHDCYLTPHSHELDPESFSISRNAITERAFLFLWKYLHGYLQHLDRTDRASHSEYLEECWRRFGDTA